MEGAQALWSRVRQDENLLYIARHEGCHSICILLPFNQTVRTIFLHMPANTPLRKKVLVKTASLISSASNMSEAEVQGLDAPDCAVELLYIHKSRLREYGYL